jgi:NAD(P)-dependent dehydrogenase (short-subunit alcohol dehydrogenase family)
MDSLFDLTGRVAIITGGSRGIGKQIVETFAAQGAAVIIASRNFQDCNEVANKVNQCGGKAMAMKCDLENLEDIKSMFKHAMEEYGKLDILVNNAGVNVTKPSVEVTEKEWDYIFNVNIKGLFFACQEAAKIMINQGNGKIINVSSIGGLKPFKRIAPYNASKAAVIHLTRSLASEWARYGIIVNGIAPGLISTDINKEEIGDERLLQKMLKMIPLRKLGQPKDVSIMALFLASDAADFITGQTFSIDGGVLAE